MEEVHGSAWKKPTLSGCLGVALLIVSCPVHTINFYESDFNYGCVLIFSKFCVLFKSFLLLFKLLPVISLLYQCYWGHLGINGTCHLWENMILSMVIQSVNPPRYVLWVLLVSLAALALSEHKWFLVEGNRLSVNWYEVRTENFIVCCDQINPTSLGVAGWLKDVLCE